MEPNPMFHYIFETLDEAVKAWTALPDELRELIAPPRQSHDCWIFDKEPQAWQS